MSVLLRRLKVSDNENNREDRFSGNVSICFDSRITIIYGEDKTLHYIFENVIKPYLENTYEGNDIIIMDRNTFRQEMLSGADISRQIIDRTFNKCIFIDDMLDDSDIEYKGLSSATRTAICQNINNQYVIFTNRLANYDYRLGINLCRLDIEKKSDDKLSDIDISTTTFEPNLTYYADGEIKPNMLDDIFEPIYAVNQKIVKNIDKWCNIAKSNRMYKNTYCIETKKGTEVHIKVSCFHTIQRLHIVAYLDRNTGNITKVTSNIE